MFAALLAVVVLGSGAQALAPSGTASTQEMGYDSPAKGSADAAQAVCRCSSGADVFAGRIASDAALLVVESTAIGATHAYDRSALVANATVVMSGVASRATGLADRRASVGQFGVATNTASKAVPDGIVYRRTDILGGKPYIGQAKSEARFEARQAERARANPDADFEFEVIGRANPGTELDRLEESLSVKVAGRRTVAIRTEGSRVSGTR